MNFIFPENYNFKNKIFGMFDYSTVIFNFVWGFLLFNISKALPFNLNIKITIFITFYFSPKYVLIHYLLYYCQKFFSEFHTKILSLI